MFARLNDSFGPPFPPRTQRTRSFPIWNCVPNQRSVRFFATVNCSAGFAAELRWAVAILSVDLAHRSWSDLGIVILDRVKSKTALVDAYGASVKPGTVICEIVGFTAAGINGGLSPFAMARPSANPVDPEVLVGQMNHLCNVRGIRAIVLDGPQAWKSSANRLDYARVSERQLNTTAKTGLPGMVVPRTYRAFAEFCMDVYEGLCRRGWRRLSTQGENAALEDRVLIESCPHAAWKSLGLKPLCSKRRARVSDLAGAYTALNNLVPINCSRPPNHDQLQAIVAGLPGLAISERDITAVRIVGNPPRREQGHWREGFIVLPLPPPGHGNWLKEMRWLN
jgi:hypothetical protein